METPGLLVVADRWDVGWKAYLNGNAVPILRVNHAVRGVVVPAGESVVQFRYEPASLVWGLRLSTIAAALMLGWAGLTTKNRLGQRTSQNSTSPTSSATPTSHQNQ
jgi:uncharacterized membrane protein YfhO